MDRHIGESLLFSEEKKKLFLKIKEQAIKNEHLGDGQISFDKLDNDLKVLVSLQGNGEIIKIQSDWAVDNPLDLDYIKNKPTGLSDFENDAMYMTLGDVANYIADFVSEHRILGLADLESYFDFFVKYEDLRSITNRIEALEQAPHEEHHDGCLVYLGEAYIVMDNIPTAAQLAEKVNTTASKPSQRITLDMTTLSKPSVKYILYPLSWESVENQFITPNIIDHRTEFYMGVMIDNTTPTLDVEGVAYRVLKTQLGRGIYTVEF